MPNTTIIDDLYRYNDWCHGRLFQLCEGLTDQQLDEPREIGFGSLRATLFHIFAAEQIWQERWNGVPWRPFPTDPQGASPQEIEGGLRRVAGERLQLMERERQSGWARPVTYRDSKGNEYTFPLDGLLMHVANHGVHHRAQALNFLKRFGRTVPIGLDYLLYRVARPTLRQEPATVEGLRAYGLEVESGPGVDVDWDRSTIERCLGYHEWANDQILEYAGRLDDAALDRPFDMGPGSIRKTLLHLHKVDVWWMNNWTVGPSTLDPLPAETSIADLKSKWRTTNHDRKQFVDGLDAEAANRIVTALPGGPPMQFRIIESLAQIYCHGTHHRAQLINMLRHVGAAPRDIDFTVWMRQSR